MVSGLEVFSPPPPLFCMSDVEGPFVGRLLPPSLPCLHVQRGSIRERSQMGAPATLHLFSPPRQWWEEACTCMPLALGPVSAKRLVRIFRVCHRARESHREKRMKYGHVDAFLRPSFWRECGAARKCRARNPRNCRN